MKNFAISTLLIFVFGNLCHFGLPWWTIVPIAAVVVFVFSTSGAGAFSSGLLAGSLLWGVNALLLNTANGGVFAAKIGQIFQGVSSTQLMYAASFMGGLLAAFGALTGQWAREILKSQPKKGYYGGRNRWKQY